VTYDIVCSRLTYFVLAEYIELWRSYVQAWLSTLCLNGSTPLIRAQTLVFYIAVLCNVLEGAEAFLYRDWDEEDDEDDEVDEEGFERGGLRDLEEMEGGWRGGMVGRG
jgi:hypothetical protein